MREMGRGAAGQMRMRGDRLAGPVRAGLGALKAEAMDRAGGIGRQDAAEDPLESKRVERSQHDGCAQGRPTR